MNQTRLKISHQCRRVFRFTLRIHAVSPAECKLADNMHTYSTLSLFIFTLFAPLPLRWFINQYTHIGLTLSNQADDKGQGSHINSMAVTSPCCHRCLSTVQRVFLWLGLHQAVVQVTCPRDYWWLHFHAVPFSALLEDH